MRDEFADDFTVHHHVRPDTTEYDHGHTLDSNGTEHEHYDPLAMSCQVCKDNDYYNEDGHDTAEHLESGPKWV